MQSFQGYAENGRIVPVGDPELPDGCKVIVTILEEGPASISRSQRQLKALLKFERELEVCNEPLSEEFDAVLSQRVNLERELDL